MKTPNISIIIPSFNESEFIDKCLEAVIAQVKPGDEVILVDNNSTDETILIASRYKKVVILREPKQGQVHAQAKGFNAAQNDILARIDADSVVADGWLERIRSHYAVGNVSAITGPGLSYDLVMQTIPALLMGFWTFTTNRMISGHYPVWGSNFAMLKTTWGAIKPLLRFKQDIWEDFEMGIKMASIGIPATYDPKLLVGYSNRSVDIRSSLTKVIFYQYRAPKTYYVCGKKLPAVLSFIERTFMMIALSPVFIVEIIAQFTLGRAVRFLRYTRPISQRLGSWL